MQLKKQIRYGELDCMRGLAALYVMIFHFAGFAGWDLYLLKAGVTGVDLFFIISGYVIFMTLEKTKKPKDFIISRLSRLWPSYLVMMTLTLLAVLFFDIKSFPSAKTILLNLTMLQTWFPVQYIDDSYWTLTVELVFYMFMLLLFLTNKLKYIIPIGASLLIFLFSFHYFLSPYILTKIFIIPRSLFPIMGHFQLFFAGILFYKMQFEKAKWYNYLLLIACYLLTLYLFDKSGRAHFEINIGLYITMIFIYFLLFYFFINHKLKILNLPVLLFLGDISYALYLIHNRAGLLLYQYFSNNFGLQPVFISTILILSMICIAALVTYKVERPIIKYIRARYTTRQSSLVQ